MILALLSFHFPIQDKFLVALSAASIQNSAYLFSDEKISYLEKKVITFSWKFSTDWSEFWIKVAENCLLGPGEDTDILEFGKLKGILKRYHSTDDTC